MNVEARQGANHVVGSETTTKAHDFWPGGPALAIFGTFRRAIP